MLLFFYDFNWILQKIVFIEIRFWENWFFLIPKSAVDISCSRISTSSMFSLRKFSFFFQLQTHFPAEDFQRIFFFFLNINSTVQLAINFFSKFYYFFKNLHYIPFLIQILNWKVGIKVWYFIFWNFTFPSQKKNSTFKHLNTN